MGVADTRLGACLRALRSSRSLSLDAAAERAGVPKSTLASWERETGRPRGPSLARLLDALEAEPRLRARLLHAADPAFARLELAHTPLGAPVDVGTVLRAMRRRRGVTQADLARAIGVTQSSVARWESAAATPDAGTVHRIGFALGAPPEEVAALSCATDRPAHAFPVDASDGLQSIDRALHPLLPRALFEVVSLGLEAEVWRRAARDTRWDPALCRVLAGRASRLYTEGRHAESVATARRALRLPRTPEVAREGAVAVTSLMEVALHRGADPAPWEGRLERLAGAMPDSGARGWILWERALRLADLGREREAVELAERGCAASARHHPEVPSAHHEHQLRNALVEVYLRAGNGAEAAGAFRMADPSDIRGSVRVGHANGVAATEEDMDAVRLHHAADGWNDWHNRRKLARIERDQARLSMKPRWLGASGGSAL